MFYIVGLTMDPKTDQPRRLAVCVSAEAAARHIETLPDYEDGRYYIDGCRETVVLDTITGKGA